MLGETRAGAKKRKFNPARFCVSPVCNLQFSGSRLFAICFSFIILYIDQVVTFLVSAIVCHN